jgi:hypothetical protein
VGLGLNICRHITRQFGGDIYITSEPGQGSRVEFTFKVHNALYKEDSVDEEDIRKQERLAKIQQEKEQKRILDEQKRKRLEESRIENLMMAEVSALGSEISIRTGIKQTLNDRFNKFDRTQ